MSNSGDLGSTDSEPITQSVDGSTSVAVGPSGSSSPPLGLDPPSLEPATSSPLGPSSNAALEARLLAQIQALNLSKSRDFNAPTYPIPTTAQQMQPDGPYQNMQMPMNSPQPVDFAYVLPGVQQFDVLAAAQLLQATHLAARGPVNFGLPGMQPQRKLNARDEEKVRRTVYITDIDPRANEEDILSLFQDCAPIVDWRICGDPNSTMRFAFIEFAMEATAKMALSKTGILLGSFPIRVSPSKTSIVPVNNQYLPRSAEEMAAVARTVYVANIDRFVERETVRDFFTRLCGHILKIRLLGDTQHNTKIAFIEFANFESAQLALKCSGALLGSLPLRVSPSKTPVRSDAGKRLPPGQQATMNAAARNMKNLTGPPLPHFAQ